jgi:hypothetical protein
MKRLWFWMLALAVQLGVATIASGVAVVYAIHFGTIGGPPDEPGLVRLTPRILAATLGWQKTAFVYVFAATAGVFGIIDLVIYLASPVGTGTHARLSRLDNATLRARVVKLLLLLMFVSAWATAWYMRLLELSVPRGDWEVRFSWTAVSAAFAAVAISWVAGPRWRLGASLATTITIASAIGVARLGGALGLTVYIGVPVLVWLVADRGIRASHAS